MLTDEWLRGHQLELQLKDLPECAPAGAESAVTVRSGENLNFIIGDRSRLSTRLCTMYPNNLSGILSSFFQSCLAGRCAARQGPYISNKMASMTSSSGMLCLFLRIFK